MKKKVKGSSPAIDTSRLINDAINPSLEGYFISLIDHNDVKNQYSDYDDVRIRLRKIPFLRQ